MSAPARHLFGTDGIRGEAGVPPLDAATALRIGQAAAEILGAKTPGAAGQSRRVILGKDTRDSGDMLEAAVAAGLASRGFTACLAGVIPTPAVAMLARLEGAAFGVVISASHNLCPDNGIKFFDRQGCKLSDEEEAAIEEVLRANQSRQSGTEPTRFGRVVAMPDAAERYIAEVLGMARRGGMSLGGLTVALDAANGAAGRTSEAILLALGAEVRSAFTESAGQDINRDCGCTHPEAIQRLVRETGATAGVSHDGDADRVLLCDEQGQMLDGDELMAIAAIDLLERGQLAGGVLVATVMSNAGLDAALAARGGKVARVAVGDRHVAAEMRRGGFNLGGEQSGHLIFRDWNSTGDGIVAALQVLAVMARTGQPLSELRRALDKFPQAQRSVKVRSKPPLDTLPAVEAAIAGAEAELGSAGRVLVRYSGTEPLVRILVEGQDRGRIEALADHLGASFGELRDQAD